MAKVYVYKDMSLDDALRKFKRQVKKANILPECKKREHFMTRREKAKFKKKNFER